MGQDSRRTEACHFASATRDGVDANRIAVAGASMMKKIPQAMTFINIASKMAFLVMLRLF